LTETHSQLAPAKILAAQDLSLTPVGPSSHPSQTMVGRPGGGPLVRSGGSARQTRLSRSLTGGLPGLAWCRRLV